MTTSIESTPDSSLPETGIDGAREASADAVGVTSALRGSGSNSGTSGGRSMSGRFRRGSAEPISPRRALASFALGGLIVLTLLAIVVVRLLHAAAVDQGIDDAAALADSQVRFIVQPFVDSHPDTDDQLLAGDSSARKQFDDALQKLHQPGVVRIKLWRQDGMVAYSDDSRLNGNIFALGDDEQNTLRNGTAVAELVQLDSPENVLERTDGDLVQVYSRVMTPDHIPMMYEVYFELDTIAGASLSNVNRLVPIFLIALIALELLQLPLAWRLIQRLEQSQRDRDALHRKVLEASDNERRRIARDLHDGVVQSLAGVSYSLSALADRLRGTAPPDAITEMTDAASLARDGVRELRTLISEIYPANIERIGLRAALADLLMPLAANGVETRIEVPERTPLSRDAQSVLYRAAQESVRNAATHSGATRIALSLTCDDQVARLVIRDNGKGFDPSTRPDDGRPHFGLMLMGELAGEVGGDAVVESGPGWGTKVVVEVPIT
jgi:two-component system, NarL family, sensor kinase